MNTVWILMGHYNYEGSDTIAAFASAESANAECKRLNDHKEAEPKCPSGNDYDSPEWTEWNRASEEWRKGLEGGRDWGWYGVSVMEVRP